MDRLSPFFSHFSLSARVFFSGKLCGASSDHETRTAGHLHVLRSGVLKILQPTAPQPSSANPPSSFIQDQHATLFSQTAQTSCVLLWSLASVC